MSQEIINELCRRFGRRIEMVGEVQGQFDHFSPRTEQLCQKDTFPMLSAAMLPRGNAPARRCSPGPLCLTRRRRQSCTMPSKPEWRGDETRVNGFHLRWSPLPPWSHRVNARSAPSSNDGGSFLSDSAAESWGKSQESSRP
jgi:hypothetical protein